jgi:hypothetical protein
MLLTWVSGIIIGSCSTFIVVKSSPLSRRERINATLETICELQDLFSISSPNTSMFEALDDIKLVVKGMQRR